MNRPQRVIALLRGSRATSIADDAASLVREAELGPRVIRSTERMFDGSALRRIGPNSKARGGRLQRYIALVCQDESSANLVVQRVESNPRVELAYVESVAIPAAAPDGKSHPYVSSSGSDYQRYLGMEGGIAAYAAWPFRGGEGEGVSIGVVELGWPDIDSYPALADMHGKVEVLTGWSHSVAMYETHGLLTIATLAASRGIGPYRGIASGSGITIAGPADSAGVQRVGEALLALATHLEGRPRVLLLELQSAAGTPIELAPGILGHPSAHGVTFTALSDLIDFLTENGVFVIEPAGNAGTFTVPADTSRALIVGAAQWEPTTSQWHRQDSNGGPGVACYGPTPCHVFHVADYSKTSAASAVVAGVAAVIQGISMEERGVECTPAALRSLLTGANPSIVNDAGGYSRYVPTLEAVLHDAWSLPRTKIRMAGRQFITNVRPPSVIFESRPLLPIPSPGPIRSSTSSPASVRISAAANVRYLPPLSNHYPFAVSSLRRAPEVRARRQLFSNLGFRGPGFIIDRDPLSSNYLLPLSAAAISIQVAIENYGEREVPSVFVRIMAARKNDRETPSSWILIDTLQLNSVPAGSVWPSKVVSWSRPAPGDWIVIAEIAAGDDLMPNRWLIPSSMSFAEYSTSENVGQRRLTVS